MKRLEVLAVADPELLTFVGHLLAYCSLHGPSVEIRMQERPAQNLDAIDDIVRKSHGYSGSALLPGQYFDAVRTDARQQRLAERLRAQLQRAFSPDDVEFVVASPAVGAQASLSVPTLAIDYGVALNGDFTGKKLSRFYMGITGAYRSSFTIPGDEARERVFSYRTWRVPDAEMIDDPTVQPAAVYEAMASSVHEAFAQKFLARWFEET